MPIMRRFLFSLIAFTAMVALTLPAHAKPGGGDPFTHFGELTKDAEHQDGFFDVYTKREDILLEIPLDRLEEPFLMISSLSKGIGTNFFLGGLYLSFGPAQMMQFERHGDRVFLVELNTKFMAEAGSPMANAVELSHANSVLASMKIKSERRKGDEMGVAPEPPKKDKKKDKKEDDEEGDGEDEDEDNEKNDDEDENEDEEGDDDEDEEEDEKPKEPVVSLVVDFGEVIRSDLSNLSLALSESFKGGYSLDKARTSMNMLKVFPENAEFDVAYVFKSNGKKYIPTLADSRYVPLSVRYSFSKLPEDPMMPRYADDRLGYFMTVHKNFSRDDEASLFVRNINRWRLEKKNKSAAMSEPVKPITFYMENTIPKEYRKYVKEGIEVWQKAFEKAGFKKAIVAKEQPNDEDWSAEDSRYSTIRWITSHNQSFGAIGPSRVDPRTGEILDADILMEANMMAGFRNTYRRYVAGEEDVFPWEASAKAEEDIANALMSGDPSGIRCSMGHDLMEAGSMLHSALVARGDIAAGEPVPMEFVGEAIVWVTAHEVGHTLGLRHNFRSSKSVPMAKLHDKAYVKANGLYGSVMDYPTVNLAANKASQG
ncbi:MAG: DUF5117 domain-containing protein, partial [Candidatus Eisenbacteria bacterium]|nr:DUF5117 domain-containing protein [Candidatus Eisenbacteria bacterium]